MKAFIPIFILLFGLQSCTSKRVKNHDPNYFKNTNRVKSFGDSLRIEYEDRGKITINHYLNYDSTNEISFFNSTVALLETIQQKSTNPYQKFISLDINDYQFRFKNKLRNSDTNSLFHNSILTGNFQCYKNASLLKDVYVLEERIEGNGTYRNKLFLIEPNSKDTVQFFNFHDPWTVCSLVWDWNKCNPMSWNEYQEEKNIVANFSAGKFNNPIETSSEPANEVTPNLEFTEYELLPDSIYDVSLSFKCPYTKGNAKRDIKNNDRSIVVYNSFVGKDIIDQDKALRFEKKYNIRIKYRGCCIIYNPDEEDIEGYNELIFSSLRNSFGSMVDIEFQDHYTTKVISYKDSYAPSIDFK